MAAVLVAVIVLAVVFNGDESSSKKSRPKPKTQAAAATSPCGPYRNDLQVRINGMVFKTETPRDTSDFDKGLAGRPCIPADQAMLFAFKKPGQYPFWMKGMKFPIDIIWIGADHKVAAAEIDESPSTYPDKFVNQKPAQFVLELKANTAKDLHIQIGTPVQL